MSLHEHIIIGKSLIKQVSVVVKFENIQKHLPFFDSAQWSEYVVHSGLPVIHLKSSAIFGRKGIGVLLDLDNNVGLWFSICRFIGNEFGLPFDLTSDIIYKAAQRKRTLLDRGMILSFSLLSKSTEKRSAYAQIVVKTTDETLFRAAKSGNAKHSVPYKVRSGA